MTIQTARYEHDCDTCEFLGEFREFDLWYHGGSGATVIARSSSDGPDYTSGLVFIPMHAALFECYLRASKAGLVEPEVAAAVLMLIDGRAR